jgi:hypothetical protein
MPLQNRQRYYSIANTPLALPVHRFGVRGHDRAFLRRHMFARRLVRRLVRRSFSVGGSLGEGEALPEVDRG